MTKLWRRIAAALATALVFTQTACGWQGVNSLPLPGTAGHGRGAYTVQVQLPDVTTVQRNSRVRANDVTIGSVTKIERQGWHALLTLSIDGDVELPANATVKVGQTSLLGSTHVEFAPPINAAPQGRLHDGSVIPLSSASTYPTTEQTLASVSLLLNNGGIAHAQEITAALSAAFANRGQDLHQLIEQLDLFMGHLVDQTADIIAATESFHRLIGQFSAQQPVLDRALKTIPDALAVLKERRHDLTEAASQFGKFSAVTTDVLAKTKQNLVSELDQIGPILKRLADSGQDLTRSLGLVPTIPWTNDNLEDWVRGDYANLTAVIDLTLSRIDQSLFVGTRFEGNLTELEMQWGRTLGQYPSPYTVGNPLIAPYHFNQGP